ncbi:uncharacterized protein LOC116337681 [Contarinia nasturtii]|uniref:uncharacterized protein LOC116337681 n=1 Tax=Contarinia nasturtii TaxID=265458 RepID=UPI0012D3A4AB|nr:uncharacterized protein LOC116337681 [Contarinia nasturtii]
MNRKLFVLLLTKIVICGLGFVSAEGNLSFSDKVIIVTGASSGIGADAAIHLAKKGASISLIGRNEKRLNNVSEEIKSAGAPTPLIILADVTTDAQRIINETVNHFGKLNILINSAGVAKMNNAENVEMADYDLLMNINVRSIVELTKFSIPHLNKTKGNIVNIASVFGIQTPHNSYVYGISKAAVIQLTKSAAKDMASNGIRVNAVAPGIIRTRMVETSTGLTSEEADQFFDKNGKAYPLGRVGEVEDTSAAIEYLASDVASFVTGTILTVDGGALVGNVDLVV